MLTRSQWHREVVSGARDLWLCPSRYWRFLAKEVPIDGDPNLRSKQATPLLAFGACVDFASADFERLRTHKNGPSDSRSWAARHFLCRASSVLFGARRCAPREFCAASRHRGSGIRGPRGSRSALLICRTCPLLQAYRVLNGVLSAHL